MSTRLQKKSRDSCELYPRYESRDKYRDASLHRLIVPTLINDDVIANNPRTVRPTCCRLFVKHWIFLNIDARGLFNPLWQHEWYTSPHGHMSPLHYSTSSNHCVYCWPSSSCFPLNFTLQTVCRGSLRSLSSNVQIIMSRLSCLW